MHGGTSAPSYNNNNNNNNNFIGRDSSVCIATRYGMDGPGIESWWGRDFPHRCIPALGPTQPPIQWIPALFPGGKAAGWWRWLPTPSSAEVKERVELYLYSPSGLSCPVLGWSLPLHAATPEPLTGFGHSNFLVVIAVGGGGGGFSGIFWRFHLQL